MDIGVSQPTVSAARKRSTDRNLSVDEKRIGKAGVDGPRVGKARRASGVEFSTPEKRVGRDGKACKLNCHICDG